MIGNKQSKFQIAIEEIKKFLLNVNQNSKMKELLTKSLSDLKEHKQFVNERQSVLFLLDKKLKLKDIQFINVTLESKNKQVDFQSGKLHYEDSSIVNWSTFHNISKEDYFITITNISNFKPIMEAVVDNKVTSEIKDKIQLFFNTELKRFLDQLDTYFTGSYFKPWMGPVEWDYYNEVSEGQFDSKLFFSSNFLSPKDVKDVYQQLQTSEFLLTKWNDISTAVGVDRQLDGLSPYFLWEKFNSEFKKVKLKIFENDDFVFNTKIPFWSDKDFIKLFSEWNQTLISETDTKKLKKCYFTFSDGKIERVVKFFITRFYHQDSTRELVLKFVSNLIRFLLTVDEGTCGADMLSTGDENDYDSFTDFILHLFDDKDLSTPLLEQFQEGEFMNILITDSKYLNLSRSNQTFFDVMKKLVEHQNVKLNITLEGIKSIYTTIDYERDNLSFILYDICHLWQEFKNNISVTVSEKEYQTLIYYRKGIEDDFLDRNWYSNVPEILEAIDNSKRF